MAGQTDEPVLSSAYSGGARRLGIVAGNSGQRDDVVVWDRVNRGVPCVRLDPRYRHGVKPHLLPDLLPPSEKLLHEPPLTRQGSLSIECTRLFHEIAAVLGRKAVPHDMAFRHSRPMCRGGKSLRILSAILAPWVSEAPSL